MDRQELALWEVITVCCMILAAIPSIAFIFSGDKLYTYFGFLIILLSPAIFWQLSQNTSARAKVSIKLRWKKPQINLSSVNLGVFCGIASGAYYLVFEALVRLNLALDQVAMVMGASGAESISRSVGLIPLKEAIAPMNFLILTLAFLSVSVVAISSYLAKAKFGANERQQNAAVKRNLCVSLVIFAITNILIWILSTPILNSIY